MKKLHILLCRMVGTNYSDDYAAQMLENAHEKAYEMQCFLRYYLLDYDVRVEACVIRNDNYCDPPQFARDEINAYWKDHPIDGFTPNHWIAWGKTSRNICGLAYYNYDRAMWNASLGDVNCSVATGAHEVGHNFGARHVGIIKENGSELEYGDRTDLLGWAREKLIGFSSPTFIKLNLDTLKERIVVDTTQQLLMCPIELSWNAQGWDEVQHVCIRKAGFEDYYISFRKSKGWRFPVDREGMLYAHKVQKDGFIKRIDPGMNVGDAPWVLPNGVTIHFHEYRDETGRVTVQINPDDPMPDSLPMPVGFPESIASATVKPEHLGAWYEKRFSGQGLNIFIKPGKKEGTTSLAVYWYTFDEKQHPIFYYGIALDWVDEIPEFIMRSTKGGTWADPTTAAPYEVGTAKLEFLDEGRGVFHYNFPGIYNRGAIEITKIAKVIDTPITGIWYDPATTGSGFTFLVFSNGIIAGDWYAYDNKGQQIWFSCEGTTADYEMIIYQIVGGEWRYFSRIERLDCGRVKLDPDTMILTYTIDAPGISDSGTRSLERAF